MLELDWISSSTTLTLWFELFRQNLCNLFQPHVIVGDQVTFAWNTKDHKVRIFGFNVVYIIKLVAMDRVEDWLINIVRVLSFLHYNWQKHNLISREHFLQQFSFVIHLYVYIVIYFSDYYKQWVLRSRFKCPFLSWIYYDATFISHRDGLVAEAFTVCW